VKAIAKDLLEKLKADKLVLDWWRRQQTRSAVRSYINRTLGKDCPETPYSDDVYEEKCELAYMHIFEKISRFGRKHLPLSVCTYIRRKGAGGRRKLAERQTLHHPHLFRASIRDLRGRALGSRCVSCGRRFTDGRLTCLLHCLSTWLRGLIFTAESLGSPQVFTKCTSSFWHRYWLFANARGKSLY
jgi:hypothetical protein